MEDELQAARERRLQQEIDQIVADFRRDFKWSQGPVPEEQQQEAPPLEEPKPSNVGRNRLKLVDTHPD
jgi:hypothetical protein